MPPESFGARVGGLRAQVEDVHHLAGAAAGVGAAHAVVAAVVDERLLDVEEAVEVDVLLGQPDQAPRLDASSCGVAEHARLAARGADQVADGGDQRRLAGAVRAEQAEELARRDDEVDGVEREQPVVVPLGKCLQFQGGRGYGQPHLTVLTADVQAAFSCGWEGCLSVTRIAIVDPQPAVRAGLTALLRSEPGLVPVGSAGTAEEALELVARTRARPRPARAVPRRRRWPAALPPHHRRRRPARRRLHRGGRPRARGRAARRLRRRHRRQAGDARRAVRGAAHRRPRPHRAAAAHARAAARRRGARRERRPRAARDARRPHAGRRRARHAEARPPPVHAPRRAPARAAAPAPRSTPAPA